MKRFYRLLVPVLLLAACTSGPQLQTYPRADIDRPHTLPKGVAAWKTLIPFGLYTDGTSTAYLPPIPLPIFWDQSLSDNFTLHWAPLPLAASYQIRRTDTHLLGLSFALGVGYGTGPVGWTFRPVINFLYRQKLTPTTALEFVPSFDGTFATGTVGTSLSADMAIGPAFQLTPVFALRTRLHPSLGFDRPVEVVGSTTSPTPAARFTLPVSVSGVWSVHRQWDVDFSYRLAAIGYAGTYTAHTGSVTVVHYW